MTLDTKSLWKISYGLYLVGSHKEGKVNAQIANTVIQVTAEPPRIVVSINKNCYTHSFIKECGCFSVSVLEQDTPMEFIGLFGFKCGKEINKFENVKYETGKTKCPIVKENAVSVLEAEVIKEVDAGTHTLFIADVVAGEVVKDAKPLTYEYYQEVKHGKASKNAPTFKESGLHKTENKKGEVMQKYVCKVCGYVYDPEKGDPDNSVNAGTKFEDIPDTWVCPVCGVGKDQFEPQS